VCSTLTLKTAPRRPLSQQSVQLLGAELDTMRRAASVAAAGQQHEQRPAQWCEAELSALDQLLLKSSTEDPHDLCWCIQPDGKWILGNHSDAAPEEWAALLEALHNELTARSAHAGSCWC
jgi:hypothetical protein